jgi:hypothetical protein
MTATKRGRAARGWKTLALLGALVTAMALAACGDARDGEEDSSPAPRARPGAASDPRAAAPAPACGWVPADAREATPVASLQADRASDPLCADTASVLDAPRAFAASVEEQLRESTKMSDEEENRIGARLEAALPRERAFAGRLDLPEDVRRYGGYVRDIVRHLAEKTTRPGIRYRVHLVRLPVFNAAAMPGGTIVVFTGTLEGREAVHDEAELAAVLGHELTHVERRHVVAAYQFARAALGEDTDEAVLAMRILTQPLSSEHELEADDRGTELAVLAQYDPRAVVNLWKRHARFERRPPHGRAAGGVLGEVLQGVDALLRSHPPAAVRACRAMDKVNWAREHAPCDKVYDGRTNLLTHIAGPRRPY